MQNAKFSSQNFSFPILNSAVRILHSAVSLPRLHQQHTPESSRSIIGLRAIMVKEYMVVSPVAE